MFFEMDKSEVQFCFKTWQPLLTKFLPATKVKPIDLGTHGGRKRHRFHNLTPIPPLAIIEIEWVI